MKVARSVMGVSAVVIALFVTIASTIDTSAPAPRRLEHVASSTSASSQTTGFQSALNVASDPALHDSADVQPLVGPLRSVKAPNLQKNAAALNAQVKRAATGAYSAAKSAAPGALGLAKNFVKGAVGGAGFVAGGRLMGRLK